MTTLVAPWLLGPSQVICSMLTDAGYQAWFVGGCVRNALMGVAASDLDISTNARPDMVMTLATNAGLNAIPTGIEHGTVTVVVEGEPFEITTFRRDVATDGRHATVVFADTMEEDARRRDFTMNALYCDAQGVVVDPLGGLPDLLARRIVFIDDPAQRIKEDYLRILRFFRFTAWYGADGIEPEGLAACAEHADGLSGLSAERITSEMIKLLAAPNPAPAIATMGQCGVLMRVLAGAAPDVLTVLIHLEETIALHPDPIRRLTALGGERDHLRLSKKQQKQIDLIQTDMPLAELAYRHGFDVARDRYLFENAALTQPILTEMLDSFRHASTQICPAIARDFMPAYSGAALGEKLKSAQSKWIASNFTLTKDDLLG